MRELDALVGSYVHLDKLPRAKDALRSLQKIASLVKPIMRKRGWRVGTLTEFWPEQKNLLGLNVNRGQKVCLRLRHPGDKTQFLPLEHVVDTMLHELSHNLVGPHNEAFHTLWNELRDEYDDLKYKGYTGEGFLSEGQRLGGVRIPLQEIRRQARHAAERRSSKKPSGQKLGGRPVPRTSDIRNVIADAAVRRQSITQGCASGNTDSESIANEATRNGFRTQAEEDQANDRAIAEALWELAQEEADSLKGPDGSSWASEGLSWSPQNGLEATADRDHDALPPPAKLSDGDSDMDSAASGQTSGASSAVLPATTYQPPAKKQKQQANGQQLLLPSTTYKPPKSPSLRSLTPAETAKVASMKAPPIPESSPNPRPNPNTEQMRPDSTTLGTTFTVPKAPKERTPRSQVSPSNPPAARDAKRDKSLPPLPPTNQPRLTSPPPLTTHPALRRGSSPSIDEPPPPPPANALPTKPGPDERAQHQYQPSVSSVTSSNYSNDSPHPSAFDSPTNANDRGAAHRARLAPLRLSTASTATATTTSSYNPRPASGGARPPSPPPSVTIKDPMWTCPVCTLCNPTDFLCCDACTTPKPCHGTIDDWSSVSQLWPDAMPTQTPTSPAELPGSAAPWRAPAGVDGPPSNRSSVPRSDSLRSSVSAASSGRAAAAARTARSLAAATKTLVPAQDRPLGWVCGCGTFMEAPWWTCSACGRMKEQS